MASSIILIFTLSVYKLFTYKACNSFKLPLFFFSLLFLIYNCYPFLILDLKSTNKYYWASLDIEIDIINSTILLLINSFYLLFLVGYKLSFLLTKKINPTHQIKDGLYKSVLKIVLLILFLTIFIFYNDLFIRSLKSYEDNFEVSNYGLYVYLKYLFIFLFTLILSDVKKITDFRIILFTICIILLSFFSSDKNPFLLLFILLFYIHYNKNSFRNLNLLTSFLLLSVVLFLFLPFFTYFRTFRDIDGFYDWFVLGNYSILSDTGGPLLSLKLITENFVNLDTNFFQNFVSFLPSIVRELFAYTDLPVEFAKKVSGLNYYGQGYGFSMISESYLYFKKNIFLFIFFVISSGFVYNFSTQLIFKKLVAQKISQYLLSLISLQLSFTILRSSYTGLLQSSFRYLITFIIIFLIYNFFKSLQNISYGK